MEFWSLWSVMPMVGLYCLAIESKKEKQIGVVWSSFLSHALLFQVRLRSTALPEGGPKTGP
jgi:hypothetical protein